MVPEASSCRKGCARTASVTERVRAKASADHEAAAGTVNGMPAAARVAVCVKKERRERRADITELEVQRNRILHVSAKNGEGPGQS